VGNWNGVIGGGKGNSYRHTSVLTVDYILHGGQTVIFN